MGHRREFHLVQDFIPDGASSTRREKHPRPPLVIPDGIAYLSAAVSGELQITSASNEGPKRGQFLLEPFYSGQQPQLLLICPVGEQVRVNGRPAPRLCVLRERDQFQTDVDHILHVAV